MRDHILVRQKRLLGILLFFLKFVMSLSLLWRHFLVLLISCHWVMNSALWVAISLNFQFACHFLACHVGASTLASHWEALPIKHSRSKVFLSASFMSSSSLCFTSDFLSALVMKIIRVINPIYVDTPVLAIHRSTHWVLAWAPVSH